MFESLLLRRECCLVRIWLTPVYPQKTSLLLANYSDKYTCGMAEKRMGPIMMTRTNLKSIKNIMSLISVLNYVSYNYLFIFLALSS